MKNLITSAYLCFIAMSSSAGMNKSDLLNNLEQKTNSGILLKTIFVEAGTTDNLDKTKINRENQDKIAQNWTIFEIAGYEFNSTSELASSDTNSSESSISVSSTTSKTTTKESLEPIFKLAEHKQLDLK